MEDHIISFLYSNHSLVVWPWEQCVYEIVFNYFNIHWTCHHHSYLLPFASHSSGDSSLISFMIHRNIEEFIEELNEHKAMMWSSDMDIQESKNYTK